LSTELTAVPITREGIIKLRKRKSLALAILDLLNRDLDALVKELFRLVKDIEGIRDRLYETLHDTYELFAEAKMILGTRRLKQLFLKTMGGGTFEVKIKERRMAGVRLLNVFVPSMEVIEKFTGTPPYNILDTSARLDDAVAKARETLKLMIRFTEVNATMNTIIHAMQITKKRINTIQYKFIPEIDKTIRYIESILEERIREDAVRLRILQRKRKGRLVAISS
jgi:V/A-type H+-transporting ATPase subunit D